MTELVPFASLQQWLTNELSQGAPGTIGVLAGHYPIMSSGGEPRDYLESGENAPAAPVEFLDFASHTWRIGCAAVAAVPAARARLVLLADDIQFMNPRVADRGVREKLIAGLLSLYYSKIRAVPKFHEQILAEFGLPMTTVIPVNDRCNVFSEQALRTRFVERIKALIRGSQIPADAHLETSADLGFIKFSGTENDGFTLVHSGHATCAGGYLELAIQLEAHQIQKLIALTPLRCMGQTATSGVIAQRLHLPSVALVNVAISDVQLAQQVVVERIARTTRSE